MQKVSKKAGVVLAAAAASLFVATASMAVEAPSTVKPVHCMGINSCKGMSECNTATHSCKGENSCRGKGWITVASAQECEKKGGTVLK